MKNNMNKIGLVSIAKNGQQMKIIEYRNSLDIDVEFEDGTIKEHVRFDNFKNGNIKNPNNTIASSRIGETSMTINVQLMKIIEYRNSQDIDVVFEDGTIKRNVRYDNFKNGNIKNDNYNKYKDRIGEENISQFGQTMKIINYRNAFDIDVRFEDGTIKEHVRYDNFKNGNIKNPNALYKFIGEEATANSGQKMRIIEYRTSTDIDIMFEDGTVRKGVRYDNFINGAISNPNRVFSINEENNKTYTNLSIGIRRIIDILKKENSMFQLEKVFDKCFYRGYLPFDIYVLNVGIIEFDGEQHFRNNSFFGNDDEFIEAMIRDQIKNCFCEVCNIPLLRIRYDQIDNIEEIVKQFLVSPLAYLKKHNPYLSNEEYYSIRQSANM